MKLTELIFAGIYRDGGSYGACFETDDGRTFNIWLQRSKMPDQSGLHHRWLFQYFGAREPRTGLPIVSGSREEKELLVHLKGFVASVGPATPRPAGGDYLGRLQELICYIERREACTRLHLLAWRLVRAAVKVLRLWKVD